MIISKLTMNHFRQFYGDQTIDFAVDEHQMVTVILGENGRGKTGIYRALLFALFGDRFLEQDAKGDGLLLANSKALKEDQERENKGIETCVEIHFSHQGNSYILHRSQIARIETNGKVKEEDHDLWLKNVEDNETLTRKADINELVYSILDDRVKHYFFFDGERIERLTRTNQDQKNEISMGIRNLLKIDQAVKSKQVLQHLLKKTNKELQNHSTGEYRQALQKREDLQKQREEYKAEKENIENTLSNDAHRYQEIEDELERFEKEKELIQQRRQLESDLDYAKEQVGHSQHALTSFSDTLSLLMSRDILFDVKKQLDLYLGEKRQEDVMSSKGIQELLEDLTCICGRDFVEESTEYQQLQSLYHAVQNQEANKDYHQLKAKVMQLIGFLDGKEEDLKNQVETIKNAEQSVDDLSYQVEKLNQQLSGTGEEQLQSLNEEREDLLRKQTHQRHEMDQVKEKLDGIESEIQKVNLQIKDLKVKSGAHQQLVKKEETLSASLEAMKRIISKFEKDVMEDLEIAATQNLSYLLDESGQENLKEVKVRSDYSLDVLNAFNQPFLANISQGQRQVLSLSFITALAQVAGGSNTLEMPLFMDTPFGRLSSTHQENLMSFIPQITSQWVLLVTDREYDQNAQNKFEQMGVVGKYYILESTEPGVTQVKEQLYTQGGYSS
ncbi:MULTISPECIES: AAA family ATPase [Pontibacillus]|uniref:Nuclease SbcCD subunit C n=1 Tax=Pontibacillus chungwhensis TaxID=265426 RepID=A0ABY8V5X6_9BACI|nr:MULTISPECIES: AAA family ATPase [Pontibacillus]MCD5324456.1 AAA family ATPase [Pontibacillus sp. HN14]WIF99251.1 AAA family ATPase [Pontibacillus chungwhensis]